MQKKKKKYGNLIREKNMIIFIDRGTTKSSYPKLCLSDNAVSFSTLMSIAGLAMHGQEIPVRLETRPLATIFAIQRNSSCQGKMGFSNICNRNDYWQHLTGFALC